MKYAVERGFRYVYARNYSERVIAECFNKDDEGCVWRVHAILNRPSRLFYIKSLNFDNIRVKLIEMSSDRQRES